MSVLDTVKKGYLHIKTATDEYMRILPRTLASLILMNDGSTAEDSINGKLNKTSVVNNLTSTITGNALDATQGKALKDEIGSTDISAIGDGTVTGAITELNGNLNNYANIQKKCLFSANKSTSITKEELKSAAGLLVTAEWNNYFVTQIMAINGGDYHFVFDNNGSLYTAVVEWNMGTGTVFCSNRNDVYINTISLLI